MEFRVLGRLEVSHDGERLDVGASKQRAVLAALLVGRNEALTADQLRQSVWWNPPAAAASNLRAYVSSLRRILRVPDEVDTRLLRLRASGYQLRVLPGELDLDRFDGLVEQAEHALRTGRAPAAADYFERALRVWGGRPLDGVAGGPALQAKVTLLQERRVEIAERWAELRLELRQARDIVAVLRALVDEHPLRETLWAYLMLALCCCGRPGEALAAYAELRTTLAEELGADPGPELRRLHEQILRHDGRLAFGEADETHAVVIRPAAGATRPLAVRSGGTPLPRQVPAATDVLCGRTVELARLQQVLSRAGRRRGPAVVAIDGVAGVGKSALALAAARTSAEWFPDGQLYANLRGATAGMKPLRPAEVLGRFLRTLGVPARAVPRDEAEAATLFRSMVADGRVLVVLDDAASVGQVRPLLPAGAGCAAVITSRAMLNSLAEAVRLPLGLLSSTAAVTLLSKLVGAGRVGADPGAATRLAALCGHLPLALRIASARLTARPGWPLADLANRLETTQQRLDELAIGDFAVRASLDLTYHGLTDQSQRALRRLGLLGSRDFPSWALAALLDVPTEYSERLLHDLVVVHLVETTDPPEARYRLHDLIRLYAREQAAAADRADVRRAATLRLADACLTLTGRACSRLSADFPGTARHGRARWCLSAEEMDRIIDDPRAWLERERTFLVTAVRDGLDRAGADLDLAGDLATALAESRWSN